MPSGPPSDLQDAPRNVHLIYDGRDLPLELVYIGLIIPIGHTRAYPAWEAVCTYDIGPTFDAELVTITHDHCPVGTMIQVRFSYPGSL